MITKPTPPPLPPRNVTLNFRRHILSLYTPSSVRGRVPHTRSVLLCLDEQESAIETIVDGLSFTLLLAVENGLSLDALLRSLILSYARRAFGYNSANGDKLKHASLFEASVTDENGQTSPLIEVKTQNLIRVIDNHNTEDLKYCLNGPFAEGVFWRWLPPKHADILDSQYRVMENINFIREASRLDMRSPHKNTYVCRLLFDNHHIMHSVMTRFRYPVRMGKTEYTVRLLDPFTKQPFEGQCYEYYIEKQFNRAENPEIGHLLRFDRSELKWGGLLQPSALDEHDTLYQSHLNTFQEMLTYCECNTATRLSRRQKECNQGFQLRYNRFFLNLTSQKIAHVFFPTRTKLFVKCEGATIAPVSSLLELPSLKRKVESIEEIKKEEKEEESPVQRPLKKVAIKRKVEVKKEEEEKEPPVQRPLKKVAIQSKLTHYLQKSTL